MTTVMVDGYNVIYAVPELARHLDRSLEAAREALVAVCQAYRARRGDVRRLCVVFDGAVEHEGWPSQERGGVAVRFTRGAVEADEEIVRMLRDGGERERYVVVSNDNAVCNNARAHRAEVVSAAEFYAVTQRRAASASRRAGRAVGSAAEKRTLPGREAQAITEEYRRHLERKAERDPA